VVALTVDGKILELHALLTVDGYKEEI